MLLAAACTSWGRFGQVLLNTDPVENVGSSHLHACTRTPFCGKSTTLLD